MTINIDLGGKIHLSKINAVINKHLNDSDEESLLVLLMHGSADGADGPAQCVQVLPGPLRPIDLVMKLFCHDPLCICIVQMGQIHYTAQEREKKKKKEGGERAKNKEMKKKIKLRLHPLQLTKDNQECLHHNHLD